MRFDKIQKPSLCSHLHVWLNISVTRGCSSVKRSENQTLLKGRPSTDSPEHLNTIITEISQRPMNMSRRSQIEMCLRRWASSTQDAPGAAEGGCQGQLFPVHTSCWSAGGREAWCRRLRRARRPFSKQDICAAVTGVSARMLIIHNSFLNAPPGFRLTGRGQTPFSIVPKDNKSSELQHAQIETL